MAAPTLTSSAISTWSDNVNTDEVTASLSWNSGDRILVVGMTEDQGFVLATPTATGLTFTALGTAVTVANSCWLHVWQATAGSSGSGAITASRATSTGVAMRGLAAFAWGSCTGFVRTNKGGGAGSVNSTQTVSVTRTQDNSAIVTLTGDWSAGSVASIGWTPAGATQVVAQTNTGGAAAVGRWGDQGATGTTSYGTTGMAGNAFTISAIEVLGTVSSSTTANAENAAAAGAANAPVPAVGAAAEHPAGAGAGNNPAVVAVSDAELASGAGAGNNPAVVAVSGAELASGAGAGQDAAAVLVVLAESATAAGAANDASAATSSSATAAAEVAAGAGAASDAAIAVAVAAEVAAGSATGQDASAGVVAGADVAAAAGSAGDASVPSPGGTESLFTNQTPVLGDNSDGTPGITTATTVRFAVDGQVSAVRFYATATVSGTYTVGLWSVDSSDPGGGTLLASKTMGAAPTGGAWNTVAFDSPVTVTAGVAYRVGVFSSAGRYVATVGFFTADLVNGNITADQPGDTIGAVTISQGTFRIDAVFDYPNTSGSGACYFTDVVFAVAGAATDAPAENAAGGGTAYDAGTALVVVAETAQAAGEAFTATVQSSTATTASAGDAAADGAANQAGAAVVAGAETATAAGSAGNPSVQVPGGVESLFTDQIPASGNNSDGTPGITVGTTLRFAADGSVTGIRFYATADTGGTWTGALYQVEASDPGSGTALAVKTLSAPPTGSAWNTIVFDSPVTVTASTAYRAAVFNDEGRYVATVGGFASDVVNGNITADADGDTVGGYTISQGTFRIDAAMGYPNGTAGSANYFVDVTYIASSPVVVNAECATATGEALFESGTLVSLTMVSDAPIDAAGTAYDATVTTAVAAVAENATAAGAANSPAGLVAAAGQNAAGAGAANTAGTAVVAGAQTATAAGDANQPGVQSSSSVTATAENAAAAGTAFDAAVTTAVVASAQTATAAGAAADATVGGSTTASAANAAGTGTAYDAGTGLVVGAETATAGGVAFDAQVSTLTATIAAADVAAAAGAAFGGAGLLLAMPGMAVAAGAAFDAVGVAGNVTVVAAEHAAAAGVAFDADVVVVQPQVFAYPHYIRRTGTYASVRRSQ